MEWNWRSMIHFLPLYLNFIKTIIDLVSATNQIYVFHSELKNTGQATEIANYYVAAGMRSNGIASAGGVGTIIADWIVNGRPPFDLYGLDISRCLGMHNNKRWLLLFLCHKLNFLTNKFYSDLNSFEHNLNCCNFVTSRDSLCKLGDLLLTERGISDSQPLNKEEYIIPTFTETLKFKIIDCKEKGDLINPWSDKDLEGTVVNLTCHWRVTWNKVNIPFKSFLMLNIPGSWGIESRRFQV